MGISEMIPTGDLQEGLLFCAFSLEMHLFPGSKVFAALALMALRIFMARSPSGPVSKAWPVVLRIERKSKQH